MYNYVKNKTLINSNNKVPKKRYKSIHNNKITIELLQKCADSLSIVVGKGQLKCQSNKIFEEIFNIFSSSFMAICKKICKYNAHL